MNESARTRAIALVGAIAGERQVAQTAGYPLDAAKMLPVADVVLLVTEEGERGAMLFRYTAHGDYGGDTWHGSAADARDQATYEYGDALGPWMDVPEDVTDAHDFAVRYAADRLDSRGGW